MKKSNMLKKILILFLGVTLTAAASHMYPQTAEEETQLKQAIKASLQPSPNSTFPKPSFIGMPEVYSLHLHRLSKFIADLEAHIAKTKNEEEKRELSKFLNEIKEKQKTSKRFSVTEAKERSLKNHAQTIINKLRYEDTSLPVFYFSKYKTFADTLQGWEAYLKENIENAEKRTSLATKFSEQMKEKQEDTETALKKYRAMISSLGMMQTGPFAETVNTVLGISYSEYTLSTRQQIWALMKGAKMVHSEIISLQDFKYDPLKSTKQFLQTHPNYTKLVLACGHFLPRRICEDSLYTKNEAGCGMCDKAPHSEEMTMSLDVKDSPDIVADVMDPRFWNAIPDERFDTISDDSLGWISVSSKLTDHPGTSNSEKKLKDKDTSKPVLNEVYRALKSKGYFIISVASDATVQGAKEEMKDHKNFQYVKTTNVNDRIFDVVFQKQ